MLRSSIDPIGRTKFSARNSNSGATNATARSFCDRSARRSPALSAAESRAARRPVPSVAPMLKRRPPFPLLGGPGVEALIQLVGVFDPECRVDVDGVLDVFRIARGIGEPFGIRLRDGLLVGDSEGNERRQLLLVLRPGHETDKLHRLLFVGAALEDHPVIDRI